MIINFAYPSSAQYTGGVVTLYHFANALARLGHEVHFAHGPANPHRIADLRELSWFTFDPAVHHHLVDDLDDPAIPAGDIAMLKGAPPRLGLPTSLVQGHWMVPDELEARAFVEPGLTVCIASWLIRIGRSYGVDPRQMVFVAQGIDHDLFRPPSPPADRPTDLALLYNEHPAKGWAVAQEVAWLVREARPDTTFQVFGVLPPDFELPPWLPFHQGTDRSRLVSDVYGRSKVFLQPSWYEGFGLTAVEAMACGCALVTTDNGGSDDYALPGETALVGAYGDPEGLAGLVLELLGERDRRSAIAAAGERFVRRFTWERAAALLAGHLERYRADPAAFSAPLGVDRPELRIRPRLERPHRRSS